MLKRIFYIFLFASLLVKARGQSITNNEVFLRYADTGSVPTDYLLVQLSVNSPAVIKNQLRLISRRELPGNVFIVPEKDIKKMPVAKFITRIEKANNLWKLSPGLEKMIQTADKQTEKRYAFKFDNSDAIQAFLKENQASTQNLSIYKNNKILSFITNLSFVETHALNNGLINGIDVIPIDAKEELGVPGFDLSVNQLNKVRAAYPHINGGGQHVSVKENFFDTADIDLKGRLDPSPLASSHVTNHANFMATVIAGAGNSVYYAEGAAPGAYISSSSFDVILPDADSYYKGNKITVQNHSYGTTIDNRYGLNALAFDENAHAMDSLLHVFSAGNSGLETSNNGTYDGVEQFANITGNFKMAKNILVAGACDSAGGAVPQSSSGPAYDGRILPHLVAFQMNGTSESAALVSGTALLLQQLYKEKNKSVCPSTLVKAILINSADDVGNPGPDYKTGFGNLNAIKALETITHNTIFKGNISSGKTDSFQIIIPKNCHEIKITLAWNDTSATTFSDKALVNDLDVSLTERATARSWMPWVLSTFSNKDSLTKAAVRKRDSLNNQEQITVDNPSAGSYTIKVSATDIVTPHQEYFIAYQIDTSTFNWRVPAGNSFAEKGKQIMLQWETSKSGEGTCEYRFVTDSNWQKIGNTDVLNESFSWTVPDTIARVLLRMKIGQEIFYCDTLLITQLLKPTTGFICGDSVMIFWNQIRGIAHYNIYRLEEKYMGIFKRVQDTFAIVNQKDIESHFLAVSPVLPDGSAGIKSYGFDYTLQGAGCYINTFYIGLKNNSAQLNLLLGTINNIEKIEFEKLSGDQFESIFSSNSISFNYSYNYASLKTGTSSFRTKITLKNGMVLYSNVEQVTFVEPGKFLILPVPAAKNLPIHIYTMIPDGEIITVSDVMGRILVQKEIQFTHELIETSAMQRGQYFYRISKNGKTISSGKIIVL